MTNHDPNRVPHNVLPRRSTGEVTALHAGPPLCAARAGHNPNGSRQFSRQIAPPTGKPASPRRAAPHRQL